MKTLPEIMQQLKELSNRVMAIEANYAMSNDYESHKFMTHLDNIHTDLNQIIDDYSDEPQGTDIFAYELGVSDMPDGFEEPQFTYTTPYAVICHGHDIPDMPACGTVCLTEEQYTYQLSRCDHSWQCPNCQASADWDDGCPATN
jgi:hypothetical protein